MADRKNNGPNRQVPDKRTKKGTFAEGHSGGPGRPKGVPNKITQSMQEMVTTAGTKAGEIVQLELQEKIDKRRGKNKGKPTAVEQIILEAPPIAAYLLAQAKDNPPQFMAMLKQLMPAKLDVEVTLAADDLIDLVNVKREQLAELRAQVIDGTAIDVTEDDDD